MVAGDPQELADFYPGAYRRLVGSLRLKGVSAADSVEVAQEAFVRLIPRWGRVAKMDSPDRWLRVVAWRIHLNRIRSTKRVSLTAAPPESPSTLGHSSDERADVLAALNLLPLEQREVAVLFYVLDLSVSSISDELEIPLGTVKSRLSRARSALVAALTPKEEHHAQK